MSLTLPYIHLGSFVRSTFAKKDGEKCTFSTSTPHRSIHFSLPHRFCAIALWYICWSLWTKCNKMEEQKKIDNTRKHCSWTSEMWGACYAYPNLQSACFLYFWIKKKWKVYKNHFTFRIQPMPSLAHSVEFSFETINIHLSQVMWLEIAGRLCGDEGDGNAFVACATSSYIQWCKFYRSHNSENKVDWLLDRIVGLIAVGRNIYFSSHDFCINN